MSRVYLSPPHMGPDERSLLLEALDSNWVAPLGPHVDAFEAELAAKVEVPHAVALSSGTAGLHLALILLGVKAGDEVLCSTLTFSASANPITYLGATPVFIDSSADTRNMDPHLVAEELEACARYEVPIIEDAAEALGATYKGKPAGSFGDLSVFSFNGNKIITTSGGGMLVSRNKAWTDRARYLATQARDPAPHYQHSQIGYNYRLSNLLAAVGRGQLRVLDERVRQRRANNVLYRAALEDLPGITFMPEAPYGKMNAWLTCIQVDPDAFGASREELRVAMEKLDIESRPVWKPMHLQPVFSECRVRGGAVSERLFERGLCLPSGSSLTGSDLERVVEVIHRRGR